MTNGAEIQKIETTEQVKAAILTLINERAVKASQSQYDAKVCLSAVSAARQTFELIPAHGTADEYGQAIITALNTLLNTYHDPDGEYTSGKSSIGDIITDISRLLNDQVAIRG